MWQYNNMDELYHYGVLGMKWGRRKRRYTSSEDNTRVQKIRKKHISEMSNQEIREVNQRLELERNYKNLTTKKSIGKKAVQAFIGTAGTIAAIKGAAETYKWAAKWSIDKIGKIPIHKFKK